MSVLWDDKDDEESLHKQSVLNDDQINIKTSVACEETHLIESPSEKMETYDSFIVHITNHGEQSSPEIEDGLLDNHPEIPRKCSLLSENFSETPRKCSFLSENQSDVPRKCSVLSQNSSGRPRQSSVLSQTSYGRPRKSSVIVGIEFGAVFSDLAQYQFSEVSSKGPYLYEEEFGVDMKGSKVMLNTDRKCNKFGNAFALILVVIAVGLGIAALVSIF